MYKKFLYYLVLPFFFLTFSLLVSNPAFASFIFTPLQTEIIPNQILDLQVNLSLQGQSNKIYYLESAFRPENSTRYFGETWNDIDWIPYLSSTNYQTLKQIITDQSGNWSGTVSAKLDTSDPLYTGPGSYTLRLKRFTESGSSNTWADTDYQINVVEELSSPSATLSSYDSSSESVTLADVADSPTPTPSQIPTPSPTPMATPTPTPSPTSNKSTFLITSTSDSTEGNTPIAISVSITNLHANTQYFLKGAFFKDGSTNYFGQSLVSGNWVKENVSYTSQLPITADAQGNWQGEIKLIPDFSDSGFTGTGTYQVKVGRYTAAGSGPTWSNQIPLTIIAPDPTQTSNPSPSQPSNTTVNTSTNAHNPSSSTNKPSAPSSTSPVKIASLSALPRHEATVEGIATTSGIPLYEEGEKKEDIQWILVGVGIVCILAALGYTLFHQKLLLNKHI